MLTGEFLEDINGEYYRRTWWANEEAAKLLFAMLLNHHCIVLFVKYGNQSEALWHMLVVNSTNELKEFSISLFLFLKTSSVLRLPGSATLLLLVTTIYLCSYKTTSYAFMQWIISYRFPSFSPSLFSTYFCIATPLLHFLSMLT